MTEFFDYKKRGVELPPGCKDLMDVLHRKAEQEAAEAASGHWVPVPKPDRIEERGMDHLERFIAVVLESPAKFTTVDIRVPRRDVAMYVGRHSKPGVLHLMLHVYQNTEEERAVRAFFSERQVAPLIDYGPDRPIANPVRGLQYPLPSNATAAAVLLRDFLQTVYEVTEEDGIDFTLNKHEQSA
jgi:hypothetical protein